MGIAHENQTKCTMPTYADTGVRFMVRCGRQLAAPLCIGCKGSPQEEC